ncbi:MAG: hypothetical protein HYX75_21005 [Acidobacteria bacterium]|nr:hypothetical protein [Acidobacteriota bacterium]
MDDVAEGPTTGDRLGSAERCGPGRTGLRWFAGALVLYASTAAIGPMWADSSKLAIYALHAYYPSLNPGDHAGWTVLAHGWLALIPWLSPWHSLHLFSALCGAIAVGLASATALEKTGRPAAARATGAMLLVALPVWWASTLTETYAMAWALVCAVAFLSARRRSGGSGIAISVMMGVAGGLAAAVHSFTILLTFPYLASERKAHWPIIALALLGGAAPIWAAAFVSVIDPLTGYQASGTSTWSWHLASFVEIRRVAMGLVTVSALVGLALGPLGAAAIYRSMRSASGRPRSLISLVCLILLAGGLASYAPFRLHLMCGMLIVGGILLFAPDLTPRQRTAHVAIQSILYLAIPFGMTATGHGGAGVRELPGRINAWYFFSPIKIWDTGPAGYAQELLKMAPARAVILADFNAGAVLKLVQEDGHLRPDVTISATAIDDALASADPASRIASEIARMEALGTPVVLADTWDPYYRLSELRQRHGLEFDSCGPGLALRRVPPDHR